MSEAQQPGQSSNDAEIEQVVQEVVSDAHVRVETLRPEEREYLKEHALKKPMGVLHIWALGVGVVITGEYFGWNPGLKEGGPLEGGSTHHGHLPQHGSRGGGRWRGPFVRRGLQEGGERECDDSSQKGSLEPVRIATGGDCMIGPLRL